ncbi:hemagglutinin repeat-containing protein, partial [Xylophilus ampelinus]|uniref:hemagglutinin repeat-containing protein n=2 Tax=Xylophilus ampelinus TaxID=54067 RepID=UPI0018F16009
MTSTAGVPDRYFLSESASSRHSSTIHSYQFDSYGLQGHSTSVANVYGCITDCDIANSGTTASSNSGLMSSDMGVTLDSQSQTSSQQGTATTAVASTIGSIDSGGNTTLRGATVAANTVTADIGGDLTVESLQDTARYDSKQ